MAKSSISSKGQITIPKEIREYLHLNEGDNVVFKYEDGEKVMIEKDQSFITCPVCSGIGSIDHDNKPCYMCDEQKVIPSVISAFNLMNEVKWRKYRISYTLLHQAIDEKKEVYQLSIPIFRLRSDTYPLDLLAIGNDYIQMKLIQEYAPKTLQNPQKFMIPSDEVLQEIKSLLMKNSSKEEVVAWFEHL